MFITNIEELKRSSIAITEGMEIVDKKTGKVIQRVILDHPERWKKTFSLGYGVYSFTDENGIYYAVPQIKGVKETLLQNGYLEKDYSSPLTSATTTPGSREYWEHLCSLA